MIRQGIHELGPRVAVSTASSLGGHAPSLTSQDRKISSVIEGRNLPPKLEPAIINKPMTISFDPSKSFQQLVEKGENVKSGFSDPLVRCQSLIYREEYEKALKEASKLYPFQRAEIWAAIITKVSAEEICRLAQESEDCNAKSFVFEHLLGEEEFSWALELLDNMNSSVEEMFGKLLAEESFHKAALLVENFLSKEERLPAFCKILNDKQFTSAEKLAYSFSDRDLKGSCLFLLRSRGF